VEKNWPVISIITVVYNGFPAIKTTIESVLQLPYQNIEYIIIDGGSTDGTANVIKSYENKLHFWVSEPDKGIYDAMNKGWTRASAGSYILYLGAGDYVVSLPDMSKISDAAIIYGNVEIGNKYLFNSTADFRLRLGNTVHHQAMLIKKSIHPSPPFSLEFPIYADFDFNQRLYKSGVKFMKDTSFRSHAMAGGISFIRNKKEMLNVINKNFGGLYTLLARVYYFLQDARKPR
jgi:glycosyltransferase involved in cell wall biosynthesis